MKRIYIDTNVLLRYFIGDVPKQMKRAKQIFNQAQEGRVDIYMSILVFHEFDYTMRHFYNVHREEFIPKLRVFLSTIRIHTIEMKQKEFISFLDMLLEHSDIDVTDLYLSQKIKTQDDTIFSFDKDYKELTSQLLS